jgi:hypothetical protein
MIIIEYECPSCHAEFESPVTRAGTWIKCSMCGKSVLIPTPPPKPAAPAVPGPAQAPDVSPAARVVVVDFDMPFWSMVRLMLKWAIASIPAAIVLTVALWGASYLVQGVVGALRDAGGHEPNQINTPSLPPAWTPAPVVRPGGP